MPATGAELTYNTAATALQMANTIMGDGITVLSATYSGASTSKAIYSNGGLSPGVVPGTTGVIFSTGRAADFTQSSGDPNRATGTGSDSAGVDNNTQFNTIAGARTYDASYIDIDFRPTGNVMTFQFVLSSEEYPEYATSQYNDVIGVWINGTHVPISIGSGTSGITNINGITQPNLYRSNLNDDFNTEMDGFTLTLSLTVPVNPGVTNSIRIGVADTSDAAYDTNLLIAADSAQTVVVARDDSASIVATGSTTINVLGNDAGPGNATLIITQINGQNVVAGQTITLSTGQQVTLNANGTLTVLGDGQVETANFTYTVGVGNSGPTDVGIVTINSIPCFVAGTRIRTSLGEVPVETLVVGDLVDTLDDGPQPLRWIGRGRVLARGNLAPIRIRAGTFGDHGTLMVSPQHRILIRDPLAVLMFGEDDVLVTAKDLVNGHSIRAVPGGSVDYVHLFFDRHQIVFSQGLATESYLPGAETADSFDRRIMAELRAILPGLDMPGTVMRAVRPGLRSFEAQALLLAARKSVAPFRPRPTRPSPARRRAA
ncbi:MAG: Hint domain-containing protein [Pseudomonadota bacterium]